MPTRRLLLLTLLFPVIVGSLILASPLFYHTLRRDSVPQDAYVIPWVKPQPSIYVLWNAGSSRIPWNLTAVMKGGLTLAATFTVTLPNQTRVIPSILYLGHDLDYLYVGGLFHNAWWNPSTTTSILEAQFFRVFFDVDNDNQLSYPEAGSSLDVGICPSFPAFSAFCGEAYNQAGWGLPTTFAFDDRAWFNYISVIHKANWDNCNSPNSLGEWAFEYNNLTGTVGLLFAKHLSFPQSSCDGLQMRAGERWVMGFLFEFGFYNGINPVPYTDWVGDWPRQAYPFPDNDASLWPKLVIDLTNPPASV